MAELGVFLAIVVGWAIAEAALAPVDRPGAGTLARATGAGVLVVHVAGVAEHLLAPRAWAGALAAGAVLAAAGIALRLWAIATLGAAFASRLDAPRLVTRGPYRWLRHPSELGLALVTLGAALVLASPLALAAGAALIPLAIVRCRREDAALIRDHPAAYLAWRARRARQLFALARLGLAVLAIGVGGCGPVPGSIAMPASEPAMPPEARDRLIACRMHEKLYTYHGGYDYERRLVGDGRIVEILRGGSGVSGRDLFSYDDDGHLVRWESETTETSYRAPHPSPLDRTAQWSKQTIVHEYDPQGRRVRTERASAHLMDADEPGATVFRDKRVQVYRHDADHLIAIEKLDGPDAGEVWQFLYDGPRLIEERHGNHGQVSLRHEYTYDRSGRRATQVVSLIGGGPPTKYAYHYDVAGRLTEKASNSAWQTYRLEYDAAGRVTRSTYQAFETRYAYDERGRIVSIKHGGTTRENATPDNVLSAEFDYSGDCTAKMTAGVFADPAQMVMEDLQQADDPRWLRVRPDREPPVWL